MLTGIDCTTLGATDQGAPLGRVSTTGRSKIERGQKKIKAKISSSWALLWKPGKEFQTKLDKWVPGEK